MKRKKNDGDTRALFYSTAEISSTTGAWQYRTTRLLAGMVSVPDLLPLLCLTKELGWISRAFTGHLASSPGVLFCGTSYKQR